MTHSRTLRLDIDVPFSYPVIFTHHAWRPENRSVAAALEPLKHTAKPVEWICVVDDGVARGWPDLVADIEAYSRAHLQTMHLVHEPVILPGGECAKNSFDTVQKVIRLARRCRLCRQSVIAVIGGGALLDAVGFAAAMVHRGIPLLRLPTTVLSQNDSGVGVKNGINLNGAKNFLGTFAPPLAVINDVVFLRTLESRDRIAGIAEAFKVAIIRDAAFLDWLVQHADEAAADEAVLETLITRCARLHLEHIGTSGDPFEFGSARPLDFGHWAAHKLESLTLHELRHGEAVAIGIAIDLRVAAARGHITQAEAITVTRAMQRAGLPVWHEALELRGPGGRRLVYLGIEEFRQHLGGQLHVAMPDGLGSKCEIHHLDEAVLDVCIDGLRQQHLEDVPRADPTG